MMWFSEGRRADTHFLHLHRTTDINCLLALVELLLEPVNVVGPLAGELGGGAAPASPHLDLADVSSVFVGVPFTGLKPGGAWGDRTGEYTSVIHEAGVAGVPKGALLAS